MSQKVVIKPTGEKAVLVGVITQQQNEKKSKEYLDELAFLVETAGAKPEKRFTSLARRRFISATFLQCVGIHSKYAGTANCRRS